MKQYLETARGIALDSITDNLCDALTSAAAGEPVISSTHVGAAVVDILELQNIVNQEVTKE